MKRTKSKGILLILSLLCSLAAGAQLPVYVWQGWGDDTTADKLRADFKQWRAKGVTGVCFNAGNDSARIALAARLAHEAGLEYHAWVHTMVQKGLPKEWYTVNRLGQNASEKPAYVPYYTTLDPRNREVHKYLSALVSRIASIKHVDYVQLDYIRYADVILARGLWQKYGLNMNGEYAPADYCYCDDCTRIFQDQTGIDIRSVADPSKIEEWAQFRCDAVTDLVNELSTAVRAQGKKISADVFPGPQSHARKMVRQEWQKWNLDAVFPMNYNDFYAEQPSWVGSMVSEETQAVRGKNIPVYSGLFICRDWEHKASVTDPEHSGLTPAQLREAIMGSVLGGAAGISLFTPESMTEAHWEAFASAMQEANEAVSERPLSRQQANEAKEQLTRHFISAISPKTKKVVDEHAVHVGNRTMQLHWSVFGDAPKDGRSLWISLHGGGGVQYRKDNIQQWTNQWRLYRPSEGVYLCPLSPVDAWNMWCQEDADEFYHQIILTAVSQMGVNPNKVYILGYSAGGDGVWRMGPRMADTWAAASMMAGHPGDVRLENLRNTPFMVWCGALDAAYQRNTLDAARLLELDSLQRNDPEGYVHGGEIVAGKGHWMSQADTAAIRWMEQYVRNPYPKKIVWQQEEVLRPSFYWVTAPQNELARYKQVRLHVEGNTIYIDRCDYSSLTLNLNDEIVNLDSKVRVVCNGRTLFQGKLPRTRRNLLRTLVEREDTSYSFPAQVTVRP